MVIISTFQNFLCWRRSSEGGVLKVSMDFTIQLSRKGFFLLNLWEGEIFAFVVDLQFNAADRNRSHGVSQAFQLTNDFLVSHLNARTNYTARHAAFPNPETTLFPSAMINNIGVKKRYREPNPFNYFTTIRMLSTWLIRNDERIDIFYPIFWMDVRLSYFLTCLKGLVIYFYPYKKVLAHFNNAKCIKYNFVYIY